MLEYVNYIFTFLVEMWGESFCLLMGQINYRYSEVVPEGAGSFFSLIAVRPVLCELHVMAGFSLPY